MRCPNKLGKRQLACLEMLVKMGDHTWEFGCGWEYGSASETDAILYSLTAIGAFNKALVVKTGTSTSGHGKYALNNRGLAMSYIGGMLS